VSDDGTVKPGKPVTHHDVALPKIYVFCNGCSRQWHSFVALAEDGTGLTGHICSHHGYAAHDMGVIPESEGGWKHDIYAKHYPDGYEVEYVEVTSKADADRHPGLVAAFAKNRARQASEVQP
jgi:hypothetical protein